jgi:hypothetical protein
MKIRVLKGKYNDIKIKDCIFPIHKPVMYENGLATAEVDASSILGDDYKKIVIQLNDYKLV